MNKEELQWLKEISTTTGISYSGDQTITTAFANKIINYIEQLEQENNKLKEKISLLNTTNEKNYNKYCDLLKEKQELRSWLEEQYQEYKETEDERGIVLTSYTIDKLNELEGGKND